MTTLDEAFAYIAGALGHYETRTAQLDLARAIERGFAEGLPILAEAGTGTGKSFAALIPAILAKKRVVVSTATIALQEQYLQKDIPFLQKALPISFTAQLVKGRSHYLSKRRWGEYFLAQAASSEFQAWLQTTTTGDYAELPVTPPSELWEEVRSDKDDCLREQCPFYQECFFFQNRRELAQADILVTNHAFLLADLAAGRQLLPPYDLLIIDEAHQFSDIATRSLTLQLSNFALQRLFARIQKLFNPGGRLLQAERHANDLFLSLLSQERTTARRYHADPGLVTSLHMSLGALAEHLRTLPLTGPATTELQVKQMRRDRLVDNLLTHCGTLNTLLSPDPFWVKWVDYETRPNTTRVILCAAPLDSSGQLRAWFFESECPSSVWMSATLTTGGSDAFAYLRKQIGLEPGFAQELALESPFDFARQGLLYLPDPPLPEPNAQDYLPQCLPVIRELLAQAQGHAFVLFTSTTAMRYCYDALSPQLPFPSRYQGQSSRRQLLDWFCTAENPVLFATASFWEGVSVEGAQLRLVIIDRIPFQSPGDPVYDARCELLKAQSGNPWAWFTQLALPYAALKLKQGAGRLIRTRRDRGVVAILDPRLTRKGYGKQLIQSLPPFRVSKQMSDVNDYL
ncbi:ATP-dependent DNA helicase [Anthocerotibacter panamensis]|uniref:ATP-dependent DNA helicase n=1 Tax=Anthocerotibacter panamensis TaxID=2857077 RepID=UPI001C407CD9|nr:helicase C-terminal domain-containing protein [Anthocerotibacter panamensis]